MGVLKMMYSDGESLFRATNNALSVWIDNLSLSTDDNVDKSSVMQWYRPLSKDEKELWREYGPKLKNMSRVEVSGYPDFLFYRRAYNRKNLNDALVKLKDAGYTVSEDGRIVKSGADDLDTKINETLLEATLANILAKDEDMGGGDVYYKDKDACIKKLVELYRSQDKYDWGLADGIVYFDTPNGKQISFHTSAVYDKRAYAAEQAAKYGPEIQQHQRDILDLLTGRDDKAQTIREYKDELREVDELLTSWENGMALDNSKCRDMFKYECEVEGKDAEMLFDLYSALDKTYNYLVKLQDKGVKINPRRMVGTDLTKFIDNRVWDWRNPSDYASRLGLVDFGATCSEVFSDSIDEDGHIKFKRDVVDKAYRMWKKENEMVPHRAKNALIDKLKERKKSIELKIEWGQINRLERLKLKRASKAYSDAALQRTYKRLIREDKQQQPPIYEKKWVGYDGGGNLKQMMGALGLD